MGSQPLGGKWLRRIANTTGLVVVRAWRHGGYCAAERCKFDVHDFTVVVPAWYRDKCPPSKLAEQLESARLAGYKIVFADAGPGTALGTIVHGFCGGAFGRDSFTCRRIEAAGPDWVVTRNAAGCVEMSTNLTLLERFADDRAYCSCDCTV